MGVHVSDGKLKEIVIKREHNMFHFLSWRLRFRFADVDQFSSCSACACWLFFQLLVKGNEDAGCEGEMLTADNVSASPRWKMFVHYFNHCQEPMMGSCHCLQTLPLLFKFVTRKAIESFVSRTNARLVGTLITIRDVSVSIATKIVSK